MGSALLLESLNKPGKLLIGLPRTGSVALQVECLLGRHKPWVPAEIHTHQLWWHKPLILALQSSEVQGHTWWLRSEFETSLGYRRLCLENIYDTDFKMI